MRKSSLSKIKKVKVALLFFLLGYQQISLAEGFANKEPAFEYSDDYGGDQYDPNPRDPNYLVWLKKIDKEIMNSSDLGFLVSPKEKQLSFPQGTDDDIERFLNTQTWVMEQNQFFENETRCYQKQCSIFIDVSRKQQKLNLYKDGDLVLSTDTSTGRAGFETPNFDTNPNGRIYKTYSSRKYPGYNNMPFAIFIQDGFAIHGSPGAERQQIGRPASHGCVRVRTEEAEKINNIIMATLQENNKNLSQIWITVRN